MKRIEYLNVFIELFTIKKGLFCPMTYFEELYSVINYHLSELSLMAAV